MSAESVTHCGCAKCDRERFIVAMATTDFGAMFHSSTMILCPLCGNKRCPRAANHLNECTGSNEPGQPGSDY